MKKYIVLVLFFGVITATAPAQNFTKITTGIVVTDGGDSRAVTWIDYDKDGFLDLFVTNGPSAGQNNFLYRNNGDGSFTKISGQPLVMDNGKSDGASWGDYNNDGNPDLCVVNWYGQNNFLYKNDGGGNFTFMSSSIVSNDGGHSETCSWGDYDNDGYLDLYVTNSDPPFFNYLYRNNGAGDFIKMDSVIVPEAFTSRGVNWIDYDNDGEQDLFITNESNQKNNLYSNGGFGVFDKVTTGDLVNDVGNSWTSSWGDIDNDGDMDVFVGNWGQVDCLYLNDGTGSFTKVTTGPVVQTVGQSASSSWIDYDNDGDLDLFVTAAYGSGLHNNSLYKNLLMENDSLEFEKITGSPIVNDAGWTYGHSWGDYDKDGDLDMFGARVTGGGGSNNNILFRNDDVSGNKWITIDCKGTTSNTSGIGAVITVKSIINGNTVYQKRVVQGQDGYCSQNLQQHFGLGNSAVVDSVFIRWPSGTMDRYGARDVNKFYEAVEGESLSVGVSQLGTEIPEKFALFQNYPNPFNPATLIEFNLPSVSVAKLSVYDVVGKEIAVLVNREFQPGNYRYAFDGSHLSGGIYFYRLETENFFESRKMMLIK
ncbi:MAG TPA: FG-GAP-like repeat-containing protein [Ignavibacteria bacterium]|nr:FG-GAP-like repeat-containing protein [Ignavibacteria bacterium]